MIADDVIERVRAAADIVQIVGEYVPLKRAGGDYRGPCPFHQGSKPNFSVSPKRGAYHCFVCHESGDVFTFLRKRLGLDWVGAVKMVGERVGIEVVDQPTRAHAPDPNEKHWELLATTAEWFRTQLADTTIGREARGYLEGRGLDAAACERFGIGFAPRDAQAMRRHLHALGFDDARQLEAGVLVDRDGDLRVRFSGRIMFPIVDEFGHHVAFGGRALGEATPKYLNSAESAVFQKRRTLYGLHTAKQAMRRAGRAIVVEGYLDAIRLALSGVEEVVAPLGTALTDEQADLLVRYASTVFLLYDSDEAGQKATFRSGLELLRHRATVHVVSLPAGEDPDTFVRTQGRAALEAQLTDAVDLFDRQLQLLERRGWFADLRNRRRAIDKLLPTIRAARDPLTRDMYLAQLSEKSQVDKQTLLNEADELPTNGRGAARRGASAGDDGPPLGDAPPMGMDGPGFSDASEGAVSDHSAYADAPSSLPAPRRPWTGRRGKPQGPEWQATLVPPRPRRDEPVERAVLVAMLADRDLVERVAERHGPSEFRDPHYRAIFSGLLSAGHAASLEDIAGQLSGAAVGVLRELTEGASGPPLDAVDIARNLARLDARPLDARIEEIRVAMGTATVEEQAALMRERMELEVERRRLVPVRSPRGRPKG